MQRVRRARQRAVIADADALDARGAHLPEQRAERCATLREWLEPLELFGAERRKIDGVADDAGLEEVAQRGGGFDAHQLLALARRRGNVRRRDDLRQLLQAVILGRLL